MDHEKNVMGRRDPSALQRISSRLNRQEPDYWNVEAGQLRLTPRARKHFVFVGINVAMMVVTCGALLFTFHASPQTEFNIEASIGAPPFVLFVVGCIGPVLMTALDLLKLTVEFKRKRGKLPPTDEASS